jgi:hypothetical protein
MDNVQVAIITNTPTWFIMTRREKRVDARRTPAVWSNSVVYSTNPLGQNAFRCWTDRHWKWLEKAMPTDVANGLLRCASCSGNLTHRNPSQLCAIGSLARSLSAICAQFHNYAITCGTFKLEFGKSYWVQMCKFCITVRTINFMHFKCAIVCKFVGQESV